MSISEKLVTIAENQQRVFDAGRNSGGGGGDYDSGYSDGYNDGYDNGYWNGYDTGYYDGEDSGYLSGLETGREEGKEQGLAEGIEQGKQEEHENFWNTYLNNPGIYSYHYLFAGNGWNEHTFKPPIGTIISFANLPGQSATSMFMGSGIVDLKRICEERNITIDFSTATGLSQVFCDSNVKAVGEINTTSASGIDYFLFNATKMVSVDKVVLRSDGSQTAGSAFTNASNLESISFEGVIGQNFDFHWSKKLSKASITSIIEHLSATASGKTLTLSATAVTSAFGSTSASAWTSLIATRSNWTISLV